MKSATLQPNLCDDFPKFGTPNHYEKLFSLFLVNGLGSYIASSIFYDNIKEMLRVPIA